MTRDPSPGQNGLTLGEQEWAFAFDPQERSCIGRGGVFHADLFALRSDGDRQRLPNEWLFWSQLGSNRLAVNSHTLNGQISAVQHQALRIGGDLNVIRRCGVDFPLLKVHLGIPMKVGGDRLIRSAVAVVVGGSFHVCDKLRFGFGWS